MAQLPDNTVPIAQRITQRTRSRVPARVSAPAGPHSGAPALARAPARRGIGIRARLATWFSQKNPYVLGCGVAALVVAAVILVGYGEPALQLPATAGAFDSTAEGVSAAAGASKKNKTDSTAANAAATGDAADARSDKAEGAVVVHVDGCVKKPGLYTLSATAHRINDAIAAAGGATSDADMTCVNVAELLEDGEKVTIPARGAPHANAEGAEDAVDAADADAVGADAAGANAARAGDDGAGSSAGQGRARGRASGKAAKGSAQSAHASPRAAKISINKASAANLETIPGIGPSTAQHIVADRAQHGKFKRLEDLMRVKGIGKKKFEKIKPHIVL